MTMRTKKTLTWAVFLLNLGSLLIFYVFLIDSGAHWPEIREVILWPITSMILGPYSALYLLRLYRQEPLKAPGHWHLALSDFYIALLFAGVCMTLWREVWPDSFLYWGAGASVIMGVWLLMCLMLAEWRGYSKYALKLPLALGLLLKSYGYLTWGAFAAWSLIVLTFNGIGGLVMFWLSLIVPSEHPAGQIVVYVNLLTLPMGWALCRFTLRNQKNPAAETTTSSSRP